MRQPVAWESVDDKPVRVVILLAIRESDAPTAHLAILATLARRLVHGEFRQRIEAEDDADALCRFLSETLGA